MGVAALTLALAGCDQASTPQNEARARYVEPQTVLARIGAAEALAAALKRESPSEQVAGYYARRIAGEAAGEDGAEAEAEAWPSPAARGAFTPQTLPIPPGGVASTRLFAPAAAASQDSGGGASGPGGFIRSEPPPFQMANLGGTPQNGADPNGANLGGANLGGANSGGAPAAGAGLGVAAVGPSGRDPFQDFLEALHQARSGDDLRGAAETLAMEATAPAALTLAGSFESESPDVAVAIYDALWRVRNLPEAARHLGTAARDGRGVAQDPKAAASYFREAAAFGDLQARRLLQDLESVQGP